MVAEGGDLRSSRFSRHPRLRQAPTRRFAKNRNLRGLGGFCGEKAPGPEWAGPQALEARAPSPLETWPTGPWGLHPATFTVPEFLTSCGANSWVRVSKPWAATITPNPLTSGGVGWFPKAELYSSRLRSSISAPSPWKPGQQAPEPCIPAA